MEQFSRHRYMGAPSYAPVSYINTTKGSPPSSVTYVTNQVIGQFDTCDDVVTKDYASLVKAGAIINNPWSRASYNYKSSINGIIWNHPNASSAPVGTLIRQERIGDQLAYLVGGISPRFDLFGSSLSDIQDVAGTAALSKAKQADLQGLVSAAEFKKTLHLLRHPISSIVGQTVDLMRNAQVRKFAKSLHGRSTSRKLKKYERDRKGVFAVGSNEWLAYRYGIRPMVKEVEGLISAFNTSLNERETARAGSDFSDTVSISGSVRHGSAETSYVDTHVIQARARAYVLYSRAMDTAERLGLSFSELPAAAWELVPYSFIADWFVNVGDFINASIPVVNLQFLATGSTLTKEIKSTRKVLGTTWWDGTTDPLVPMSGTSSCHAVLKDREPGLVPKLSYKPGFFAKPDARWLDGLYLTINILRRANSRSSLRI